MSLSDRDKKIVMVLVPLLLVGAFIFFVIKPKREEAAQAAKALETQRERRDAALATEQRLLTAKQSFTADYTTVVRLGKAVPTDVDMPSVLVQLERAAEGTRIDFGKIVAGQRITATGGGSSGAGAASGGSSAGQPVAAGGAQAQSGAGQATEKANTAAATSEQTTASRESASPEGGGASGAPAGGSGSKGAPSGGQAVAGLDTVPLELQFTGNFFDLADFFHSLKRFVHVANSQLLVKGRLMTVDSFSFNSESFPKIKADMKARIFLAPQQQGATAGASPSGPSAPGSSPASSGSGASPTPPTAAASGVAGP